MTLGEKIRNERLQQGMTQKILAEKLGVDQGAISRMEADKRSVTDSQKQRMAALFGIDILSFFYEKEK